MLFTLEALEAKHGDSLLLHYGTKSQPKLIVIDGGPAGVFNKTLKKRLAALKARRSPNAAMPIRMVMVSHIDDDHINGILKFFGELEQQAPREFQIATLWHNGFDDILNNAADELTASLKTATKAASAGTAIPANLPIHRHGAIVLASVKQGRDLRLAAERLGLTKNEGFTGLVSVPAGQTGKNVPLGNGLTFTVLGPRADRVKNLQEEWDTQIDKMNVARVAEFVDKSVFNLSSIIVLAKAGGKTMLLTGDARGDDILAALKTANLLKNGVCNVDILKLPHHGSDHNVATEFFRQVTAGHYVCSGNGEHGNPEEATLKMILDARGKSAYTIHLTNREPRLEAFFKKDKTPGKKYKVIYRDAPNLSLRVDLGEALPE